MSLIFNGVAANLPTFIMPSDAFPRLDKYQTECA